MQDAAVSQGPWLPKGPYRIDSRYGRRSRRAGWILRILGLLFLALGIAFLVTTVPPLQRDASV